MFDIVLLNLLILLHFLFIVFVMTGALLSLKWPAVMPVHLAAAVWAVYIEFAQKICPLTPLEQQLRHTVGMQGYHGGFIEYYLLSFIYPKGLTHDMQIILGILVIVVNAVLYGWLAWRLLKKHQ